MHEGNKEGGYLRLGFVTLRIDRKQSVKVSLCVGLRKEKLLNALRDCWCPLSLCHGKYCPPVDGVCGRRRGGEREEGGLGFNLA